jgi:hypothetical protein
VAQWADRFACQRASRRPSRDAYSDDEHAHRSRRLLRRAWSTLRFLRRQPPRWRYATRRGGDPGTFPWPSRGSPRTTVACQQSPTGSALHASATIALFSTDARTRRAADRTETTPAPRSEPARAACWQRPSFVLALREFLRGSDRSAWRCLLHRLLMEAARPRSSWDRRRQKSTPSGPGSIRARGRPVSVRCRRRSGGGRLVPFTRLGRSASVSMVRGGQSRVQGISPACCSALQATAAAAACPGTVKTLLNHKRRSPPSPLRKTPEGHERR